MARLHSSFRWLLLAALVHIHVATQATVHTVSNATNHPAQFTSVQTAVNTATAGDTILVTGSATSYGTVDITKAITLIGAGHNASPNTQFTILNLQAGSSNTKLIGVLITATCQFFANLTNITVERCRINGTFGPFNTGYTMNGLVVRNCVFPITNTIAVGNSSTNIRYENNIFAGTNPTALNTNNATNVSISHNLFMHATGGTAFNNVSMAIISDNIFWGRTPVHATVNNCTFNNNITFETTNDAIPFGSNVGSNNQTGVDPLFVNAPARTFNLGYNYNVQASSPGHAAGSDGTDIGVFGGAFPFVDLTGRPRIPLVTTLTILNNSIGQGGSLNVEMSGTKVD